MLICIHSYCFESGLLIRARITNCNNKHRIRDTTSGNGNGKMQVNKNLLCDYIRLFADTIESGSLFTSWLLVGGGGCRCIIFPFIRMCLHTSHQKFRKITQKVAAATTTMFYDGNLRFCEIYMRK